MTAQSRARAQRLWSIRWLNEAALNHAVSGALWTQLISDAAVALAESVEVIVPVGWN